MNQLQGTNLPTPRFRTGPLSPELFQVDGYTNLQTFFPTLTKLFRLGKWNNGEEIWMDTCWRIQGIDCSGTSGPCTVTLKENKVSQDVSGNLNIKSAYLKVTHLLDPVHWMHGQYSLPKQSGLPWHRKGWQTAFNKLQDPGNQAYIDAICSYVLGKIAEDGISPHFNTFYGGFCARAKTYRYNLTDEFNTYRYERWFWKGYNKKLFKFKVINNINPDDSVPDDVMEEILHQYNDDESSASESLSVIDIKDEDAASLHSETMSGVDFVESEEESTSEAKSSTDSSEPDSDYTIYAEMENYPVMLILTEKSEGTMDELFENSLSIEHGPKSAKWEQQWTAWLFQIIAALSCLQTLIGFTHNDLHTNNIVWIKTSEEYLYYTSRSGTYFKVPTFGIIFRIIDFGRAIFTINKTMYISDDFKDDNDAGGQYIFKPLVARCKNEVRPNPSFDLCRLAVSMIDGVFPKKPEKKVGGAILSNEDGLVVYETKSHLYNLIWSWMIDDSGCNIYINPDGTERFPDFDLYKYIARHIHNAIPSQQFTKEAFQAFCVNELPPATSKVYSLFC